MVDETVKINDAGIGMKGNGLVNNRVTLAKSGTWAFMRGDVLMIRRFGVDFSRAFSVSDQVRVVRKNYDCDQRLWESAAGGFTGQRDRPCRQQEL